MKFLEAHEPDLQLAAKQDLHHIDEDDSWAYRRRNSIGLRPDYKWSN